MNQDTYFDVGSNGEFHAEYARLLNLPSCEGPTRRLQLITPDVRQKMSALAFPTAVSASQDGTAVRCRCKKQCIIMLGPTLIRG